MTDGDTYLEETDKKEEEDFNDKKETVEEKEEDKISFIDKAKCINCKHCYKKLDYLDGKTKRYSYKCKSSMQGTIDPNGHCSNWEEKLEELEEETEELTIDKKGILKEIELPQMGKLVSNFTDEFVGQIQNQSCLFFRPDSREIIEINKIINSNTNKEYTGFINIKPNRFITIVEKYITPGYNIWNEKQRVYEFQKKSMPNSTASVILESDILHQGLPMIERIFQVPIPIMHYDKLTFPKSGYDSRFNSWTPHTAPQITNQDMKLKEAKEILKKIYSGFCFKDEQDYINSVAALLTPFLKGLYSQFNIRDPVAFYRGNRERVGKDYCAGITGIVYEGEALEEPPISSNERGGNANEEVRKKIMAAFIQGRKRFHSSNNKGLINNAVLEGVLTSQTHSDRILGRSEIATFDNEICFSMSGNMGTSLTPDLSNRCIFVNLFYDQEDANARTFKIPNMHAWVKENRSLILSALYCLVKNWIAKGKPNGSIPFASYPEWSSICGGILESSGIGNPCIKSDNGFVLSYDSETEDMKLFFELMFEKIPNLWLKKSDMKRIIKESQEGVFSYLDFEKMSDLVKFGKKIDKYIGRVLSDIRFICREESVRSSRREYKFVKELATFNKTKEIEK